MSSFPLADSVRFEIPAHHGLQADSAGVVSIAKAHLDALPNCLLSIAAQQAPADQVVRLSAWPEPNLAVFKVIQLLSAGSFMAYSSVVQCLHLM